MKNHLNHKLRQARLRRYWTMKQAAVRIGVSFQTYIRWELGTQVPHLSSLELLCEAFNMTPEELGFDDLIQVVWRE